MSKRRFILTGPPGIGKTTIVKSVCSALQTLNIPVNGFYTEELRRNNQRIGFDVIGVNGERSALARITDDCNKHPKVGKYSVLLEEFETAVLPIFQKIDRNSNNIIVIDEIGKMELFSNKFITQTNEILQNKIIILLATIPIAKGKPLPLVERIRSDSSNELIVVDMKNRNEIPKILADKIIDLFNKQ